MEIAVNLIAAASALSLAVLHGRIYMTGGKSRRLTDAPVRYQFLVATFITSAVASAIL